MTELSSIFVQTFKGCKPTLFKNGEFTTAERHGLLTFQDIVEDKHSGFYKTMKAFALDHPDSLTWWNNYFTGYKIIPSNIEEGAVLGKYIGRFFKEFCDFVTEVENVPFPFMSNNRRSFIDRNKNAATVFKKIFLDGISYEEVAIELGKNPERIRQIVKNEFILELQGMLNGKAMSDNYVRVQMCAPMISMLIALRDSGIEGMMVNELKDKVGARNDNVVDFVVALLGYKVLKDDGTYRVKGDYIISAAIKDVHYVRPFFQDVFKMFNKDVTGIRESTIIKEMRKKHNENICKAGIAVLRHCNQIEIEAVDDTRKYRLKWAELSSTQARVERILFEANGGSMNKEQIKNEFNRRRIMAGEINLPDDIYFSSSDYITGANDSWRWTFGERSIVTDCRQDLRKYVSDQGGTVSFDQVHDYVTNILRITLKESSLRAYLTAFCTHNRRNDTFTIKNNTKIGGRGDITKQIVEAIKKNGTPMNIDNLSQSLDVNGARVRRYLNKGVDDGIFKKERSGREFVYKINPNWDGKYKPAGKVNRTPAYYSLVTKATVDMIKKSPNREILLNDIVKSLCEFVPDIFVAKYTIINKLIKNDSENFVIKRLPNNRIVVTLNPTTHVPTSKEFDLQNAWPEISVRLTNLASDKKWFDRNTSDKNVERMYDIMCNGVELSSNTYLWLMMENLLPYLKDGDKLSRNDLEFLRNLISLNYEKYLRNLYEMNTGNILNALPGLGNVVKELQGQSMIWPRTYGAWTSDAISRIIKARGAIAHPDTRDGISVIKSDILDFIHLYILTATKLIS